MKYLLDKDAKKMGVYVERYPFVGGQLLTTRREALPWDGEFAVDNFAFTECNVSKFVNYVKRLEPYRHRCLWVAVPDVVGSARRTLEVFDALSFMLHGWPIALVCQDGQQDLPIPWDKIDAVFIGGTTEWKMSDHVKHIIRAAQLLGKKTHAGRVNTPSRFAHFDGLGVDTCDGSGVSQYDHMLDTIADGLGPRPLLEMTCSGE